MDLSDRFTRGLLIGLSGGMINTLLSYPLFLLKLSTIRLADFAAILLYGHKPEGVAATIFAIFLQWGFAATGGVIFIYLLKAITTKNLILKSWFFGIGIWFFANGMMTLYKVPKLTVVPFKDAVISFAISSIYGLFIGWAYGWSEKRWGVLDGRWR